MPGNRPDGTGEINMDDVNKEVKLLVTDPRHNSALRNTLWNIAFEIQSLRTCMPGGCRTLKSEIIPMVFVYRVEPRGEIEGF